METRKSPRRKQSSVPLPPLPVQASSDVKPVAAVDMVASDSLTPAPKSPPPVLLQPQPTPSAEPMTLIDPVTGLLIPMRESEEGQYIPVNTDLVRFVIIYTSFSLSIRLLYYHIDSTKSIAAVITDYPNLNPCWALSGILSHEINTVFVDRSYPNLFKISKIMAICKKGNKPEKANYRPNAFAFQHLYDI